MEDVVSQLATLNIKNTRSSANAIRQQEKFSPFCIACHRHQADYEGLREHVRVKHQGARTQERLRRDKQEVMEALGCKNADEVTTLINNGGVAAGDKHHELNWKQLLAEQAFLEKFRSRHQE